MIMEKTEGPCSTVLANHCVFMMTTMTPTSRELTLQRTALFLMTVSQNFSWSLYYAFQKTFLFLSFNSKFSSNINVSFECEL